MNRTKAAALGLALGLVVGASAALVTMPTPLRAAATPASSPEAPMRPAPSLLMGKRVITDVGPGGMPIVVTAAFDAFEILGADGSRRSFPLIGVAIGDPIFDGEDQIAYWSRDSLHSGAYRVSVWSATTQKARVVFEEPGVRPAGDLIWTSDRNSVIVPSRRECTDPTLLRRVNVDGSGAVQLLGAPASVSLAPIYYDGDIFVVHRIVRSDVPPASPCEITLGISASSYVVTDARTGAVRSNVARGGAEGQIRVSPSGIVAELTPNFESVSRPLHIWSAAQPGTDLVTYDNPGGIGSPRFWPGRTEVVFMQDWQIVALDYASRSSRSLVLAGAGALLVGFDPSGSSLVFRTDAGYAVAERIGVELRLRTDVRYAGSFSNSVFEPLAVLR